VSALFFAVAGAELDFAVLSRVCVVATSMLLGRIVALRFAAYLGARLVKDPPTVGKHAWLGFLVQAGLTLGIANLTRDNFPMWGGSCDGHHRHDCRKPTFGGPGLSVGSDQSRGKPRPGYQ
jgi:hypothetical protein